MKIEQALVEHLENSGLFGSGYDLFAAGVALVLLLVFSMSQLATAQALSELEESSESTTRTGIVNRIVGITAIVTAVAVAAVSLTMFFVTRSNAQDSAITAWQAVERDLHDIYAIDGAGPMDDNLEPVDITDGDLRNWSRDLALTIDSVAERGTYVTVQTLDAERHTYQLAAYGGQLRLLDDAGTAVEPDELLRKHEGSNVDESAR